MNFKRLYIRFCFYATIIFIITYLHSNGYKEAREWLEIGNKFFEFKKYDEAISYYDKAIELNRDYGYGAAARYQKAHVYIALLDMDKALINLWIAMEAFPYVFLGDESILKKYDYYQEAKILFDKLKQDNKSYQKLWFSIQDNSPIKEKPSFSAKTIEYLKEGEQFTYIEKSENTFNQNFHKVPSYQGYHWYKIKSKDNKEGWIFGQYCQSHEILTTNLYRAIRHGKLEYVEKIFEKGANANVLIEDGNSPLHHAAKAGHFAIVEFLLQKDAKVNIRGIDTYTPLHFAKNKEVAKLLIESGAEINAKGWSDMTPLHIAVEYGDLELIRFYIESGADINAKGIMNATPLDLAKNEVIKKYLEKKINE